MNSFTKEEIIKMDNLQYGIGAKFIRTEDVIDWIGYIRSHFRHNSYEICKNCSEELDCQEVVSIEDLEDFLDKEAVKLLKGD